MMQLNASLVASWFPDWPWVDDFQGLKAIDSPNRVIFAPKKWLGRLEDPLPESWDVTSDSIAARLAHDLNADELVLFKSADPPPNPTGPSIVTAGYVDSYFPRFIQNRPVRLVNLRAAEIAEVALDHPSDPAI